ncbi:protein kinase domain-containing protein [Aliarcobacter cryaerophilus]|uniref:protein kinase domain-containing protein n=1 Tax=Aliarcobacter cryaerophilus TaxID=28198 RepID=UPI0008346C57|nr:protein kinase [Aliarcobacter cryaerophilus]
MEIIDNVITINGTKLHNYKFIKKLGEGANGIVYLVENILLERKEALKIWRKKNLNDERNKVVQGLKEAAKQANIDNIHSVKIYHIDIVNDIVYATMEYVNGITLKEYCESTNNKSELILMAYTYLKIIQDITTKKTIHGDPHWKNVIIFEEKISKYTESTKNMKFCDFGTSYFVSKESSKNRHWKIVKDTILNITKKFDSFEYAKKYLEQLEKQTEEMIQDLDNSNVPNINDFDESLMRTAALRDYLEYLTIEINSN